MAKKKNSQNKSAAPTVVNAMATEIADERASMIANGLTDAIMGLASGGLGVELSQTDTLFKNLRWYLVSNMRQLLSQAYAEHGLVQTIVDVPVDDGLRGGIEIKSKQLSEDNVHELLASLEADDDLVTAAQALKWNRLFGGAGVLINVGQPPDQPFSVASITKDTPLEFRAVDMWELFHDRANIEGELGPTLIQTKLETYNYYGKKLHVSRVLPLKGLTPPSFMRPRLRGWGFSVVEALVRSMNQYLKANNLGFEVLDEFKLDIFKIKGLTQALMSPTGSAKIRERIALANQQKNYQNSLAMDAEDDYVQKQLSWSGLADAMAGIRIQVAADMRMPLTKLFGVSAAGFNSGEDDIEVYNAMVESQVRSKGKHIITAMVKIKCQKLFGFVPDDLTIDFTPLRVLSAEQEENVKTQKFNRALQARQAGEITALEFREIVNRDNLLSMQLDTSNAVMTELEEENEPEPTEEGGEGDGAKPKMKTGIGEDAKSKLEAKAAPKAKNSLAYDMKAYEVDGGDNQFDAYRERELDNPMRVPDRALVKRGEEASQRAFGKRKWQFVYWFYKQHGGKLT